jgi:hypothetical protein
MLLKFKQEKCVLYIHTNIYLRQLCNKFFLKNFPKEFVEEIKMGI